MSGDTAPLPFVRSVIRPGEVGSTNVLACELLREGASELPLLVWAARQVQGRGQRASTWWSDEGSLTFTLAIDPHAHGLRPEQVPRISLMTAVAVIDAIEREGLVDPGAGLGIRWPNDIEAGGRKLAGILPEGVPLGDRHRLVVGIGLNVTSRLDLAPPEVRGMATSLSELRREPLDSSALPRLLRAILEEFAADLARLAGNDPDLAARWDRLDLLRGRPIRVALGPRTLEGTARGIDAGGALLLDDDRQTHRLFGGQVLREPIGPG